MDEIRHQFRPPGKEFLLTADSTNFSPPPAPVPAVTYSLACVHCGYDLLSQPLEGVCPECAHPVRGSLRGDWLQFCHPDWVRSLSRGIILVFFSATANVVLYLGL